MEEEKGGAWEKRGRGLGEERGRSMEEGTEAWEIHLSLGSEPTCLPSIVFLRNLLSRIFNFLARRNI